MARRTYETLAIREEILMTLRDNQHIPFSRLFILLGMHGESQMRQVQENLRDLKSECLVGVCGPRNHYNYFATDNLDLEDCAKVVRSTARQGDCNLPSYSNPMAWSLAHCLGLRAETLL